VGSEIGFQSYVKKPTHIAVTHTWATINDGNHGGEMPPGDVALARAVLVLKRCGGGHSQNPLFPA